MLAFVVVGARLAQYVCAMVLMGAPLFFLYGLPQTGVPAELTWTRPLLRAAAAALLSSATIALFAQTAVMVDSVPEAFKLDNLATVLTNGHFGIAIIGRLTLSLLALLALMFMRPSRRLWISMTVLGTGIVASFAWTGHGASDEGLGGLIHTISDVLHLIAAAVWMGALAAFALLLLRSHKAADEELSVLYRALAKFSGIGSAVVAVLLATGLINTWYMVGPSHVLDMAGSVYGQLLLTKLALFTLMLGLAAANRFAHTPRLGAVLAGKAPTRAAVAALRRSVVLEASTALIVVALVAVLGTLAPPMSQ